MSWDADLVNGLPFQRITYADLEDENQFLLAVDLACEMIGKIPGELRDASSETVRVALIQAWFINMRLLIEFLGLRVKRSDNRDYHAGLLLWKSDSDLNAWEELWQTASKWVAHLSLEKNQNLGICQRV